MNYGFIYETTNLINGKKYIGSHVRSFCNLDDPDDSWYLGSGVIIERAINKYGVENFSREILCECSDKQELIDKESYYLELVDAASNPDYYNLTNSGYQRGTKGYVYSQESLDKMSDHNHVKLYGRTEESKIKQSLTLKERNHQHILADRVRDSVWVTNGSSNKRIFDVEAFFLENPEWYRGFSCRRREHIHSEESKLRLSENKKAYAKTDEGKAFYTARMKDPRMNPKGKIWISKDGKRKLIYKIDITSYESEGWKRGMNN